MFSMGKVCLALIAGTMQVTGAVAQNCSEILKYGIWETTSSSSFSVDDQSYNNWMCSSASSSAGGSINSSGFGGGYSQSDAKNLCSMTDSSRYIASEKQEQAKRAAVALTGAWDKCMNSEGSHATVLIGKDPAAFTIQLRRRDHRGDNDDTATLDLSSIGSVTCRKSGTMQFKGDELIQCRRTDIRAEVALAITFQKSQGVQLYVAATPVPAPQLKEETIKGDLVKVSSGFRQTCQGDCGQTFCLTPTRTNATFVPDSAKFIFEVRDGPAENSKVTKTIDEAGQVCYFLQISLDKASGTAWAASGRIYVRQRHP